MTTLILILWEKPNGCEPSPQREFLFMISLFEGMGGERNIIGKCKSCWKLQVKDAECCVVMVKAASQEDTNDDVNLDTAKGPGLRMTSIGTVSIVFISLQDDFANKIFNNGFKNYGIMWTLIIALFLWAVYPYLYWHVVTVIWSKLHLLKVLANFEKGCFTLKEAIGSIWGE